MAKRAPDLSGRRPRVAVHKFSSCDGCQLAFLNAGEDLLRLAERVDIVHFAEAGVVDETAEADVAFIEGSISTPAEVERIEAVRARSRYLVPIGACATAGGPQALRNLTDAVDAWVRAIYERPEDFSILPTATRIADHVPVDLELPGCPVTSHQVLDAVSQLLHGAAPVDEGDKVCIECKRRGYVCVLVAKAEPCMGPLTHTGCGALCPGVERDCYGCFGPAENPNTASLTAWFTHLGLSPAAVARRFMYQNSGAPAFHDAARRWQERDRDESGQP